MNWLDALFVVIFIASTLLGAAKGFTRIGIGLAATILGILFASHWYAEAGYFLREYVTSRQIANALGFFLVLMLFLVVGGLLSAILSRVFKWAGVSWLDRLLGAVFGFLRGLLICIAVVMIGMAFPRDTLPQAIIQSRIAPYIVEGSRVLVAMTPPEFKDAFHREYEKVKAAWSGILRT